MKMEKELLGEVDENASTDGQGGEDSGVLELSELFRH